MNRQRILEIAVGVFTGNLVFFFVVWLLFASLSRVFGVD